MAVRGRHPLHDAVTSRCAPPKKGVAGRLHCSSPPTPLTSPPPGSLRSGRADDESLSGIYSSLAHTLPDARTQRYYATPALRRV